MSRWFFFLYFLFDKSCGIIVESLLFVDFVGYIYPWILVPTKINVYQTYVLSFIEMKQNMYLQIYLLKFFLIHENWAPRIKMIPQKVFFPFDIHIYKYNIT